MIELEILRGPESYFPENLQPTRKIWDRFQAESESSAPARSAKTPSSFDDIPESRGGYAEIYSTKHQRVLLRVDHITKMDAIRKGFNASRLHPGQRSLTTSDIVNGVLDFAFEHRIPFYELQDADGLKDLISKSVYRSVLSRWKQFNEAF
ncbi:MAG: hypothetical protein HY921_12175 [Elusimicrobia bacterium]|nr:hypothetical protein [Elusimicrobiota bacterium]